MGVRLHFVVEGQTEETFVNRVLVPHLSGGEVWADVRRVETSRGAARIHRGGGRRYEAIKKDLHRWMKQDQRDNVWFTTMFDLYGLRRFRDEFPGMAEAGKQVRSDARVQVLEKAFNADIGHQRFLPYLQLHEFEALVLVDPDGFRGEFDDCEEQVGRLHELIEGYTSPEEINEGEETAPSKRIITLLPAYEGRKSSAGPIMAERTGLPRLREKCPHFNEWITKLEALG